MTKALFMDVQIFLIVDIRKVNKAFKVLNEIVNKQNALQMCISIYAQNMYSNLC